MHGLRHAAPQNVHELAHVSHASGTAEVDEAALAGEEGGRRYARAPKRTGGWR